MQIIAGLSYFIFRSSALLGTDIFIYSKIVRNKLPKQRIYDLVDAAIFDFLIQNGDRHHYEVMDETVVFIDNGKGLGNAHKTFLDILAPLYQCCM